MKFSYTKITLQDIEIAEKFFENEKHLDEFLANVCRYYSNKNLTIKSKIVQKYFETYKKVMDIVIVARDYGNKGGTKRVENQSNTKDTLEGGIEETLVTNIKEIKRNKNKIKEININECDEIYNLYPSKCNLRNSSLGKNKKNKSQIQKLLKEDTFENISKRITNYLKNCNKSKTYLKNFTTLLNQLPELEENPQQTQINNETIVVFTDGDDIDPNREHKVFKKVYDEYLQRGKQVKFIRYAGF